MDPISLLPSLCIEYIFNHFNGRELLQLMTVNKSWHQEITLSSFLMSRLKLEIRTDWLVNFADVKNIAERSDRAYSHFMLSEGDSVMEDVMEILSHPRRRWKTVQVYQVDFTSSDEIEEFMGNLEETVQSMTLQQVAVYDNSALKLNNFKKLHTLSIFYVDSLLLKPLFNAAINLNSLDLGCIDCILDSAIVALKNLTNLKKLSLCKQWLVQILDSEDFSDVKFQLEEFSMVPPYENTPQSIDEKFLKFLQTQQEMRKILLTEWFGFKVLDHIFQMPKLKDLTLYHVPEFGWETVYVAINRSIDIFDIKMIYVEPHTNNIQNLLSRVPNVKHIKLRYINESIGTYMLANLNKIETISLVHEESEDSVRHIFPHNVLFIHH